MKRKTMKIILALLYFGIILAIYTFLSNIASHVEKSPNKPPQPTEIQEESKTVFSQEILNILRNSNIEALYLLEDNRAKFEDEDSYYGLYFDPMTDIYYDAIILYTNQNILDEITKTNSSKLEEYYIKGDVPYTTNFQYIGEISPTKRVYSNQHSIILQKLTPFFFPSLDYNDKKDYKIVPLLPINSTNYIFTDDRSLYQLSASSHTFIETDDFSSEIQSNFQGFQYFIPDEIKNTDPEFTKKLQESSFKFPSLSPLPISLDENIPILLMIAVDSSYRESNYSEIGFKYFEYIYEMYQEYLSTNFAKLYSRVNNQEVLFPLIPKTKDGEPDPEIVDEMFNLILNKELSYYAYNHQNELVYLLENKIPIPDSVAPRLIHTIIDRGLGWSYHVLSTNYPDFDYSVTNSNGESVFQASIKDGRYDELTNLIEISTNFNPHEVTSDNKTWIDLAYELPILDPCAPEGTNPDFGSVRKFIIEEIAPKYNITNNILLNTNITFDSNNTTTLRSIQAKILETNSKFIPIDSYQLEKKHRKVLDLKNKDIDILEFVGPPSDWDHYFHETYEAYDKLIRLLVNETDIDYHKIDTNGNNILYYVMQTEQLELFKFLIDKGVSIHHTNNLGQNLLHLALPSVSSEEHFCRTPKVSKKDYALLLIELGVDINGLDNKGYTPYNQYRSGSCASKNLLKKLEEHGGKTNIGIYKEPGDECIIWG